MLYGSITGTVRDQQGAAIPGATVTATNTGTGNALETVSDAQGNYTFRNLLPGVYDVGASLQGFRELKQTGLRVSAGNPVRVDLRLEVGALAETVNVVSETTLLQTEKADLSTELTGKDIVNLPLNQYRNYQQLMNLVPGATPVQFQNAEIDTPGRSLRTWVNGVQPNANTTRLDGAVSVNVWLPHHAMYVQPAETIESVNVATNNFDADQGMAGGAAMTVITKSGTNELHGSAFWFLGSEKWNANSLYNNAFNLKKPPLNRDIYGGTLGGPIVRNKLFFFGSWERFQDRRAGQYTYVVPTDKMRSGDFTEVAAAYSNFRLYNPYTGSPDGTGREQFSNFTIPSNLISPIAQQVMSFYPPVNSNLDLNSNGLLDDYVIQREGVVVDRDNFDAKLTWQPRQSQTVWGRFSMLDAEVVDNYILGFDNGSLGDTRVYVGTVGTTWTISPTLVFDANVGISQQNQEVTGPDYGTNYGQQLGIPGTNGPSERYSGLPTFNAGYNIGSTPSWMPLFRKERNWTASLALTKVFPKHEIRAGFDFVRLELNHFQAEWGDYGLKGGFNFSGNVTGAPGYTAQAWNQFGAFLLGLPNYYAKDEQEIQMTGRENQYALYVRDRWSVSDKLTLSLGVRMEYYPLMTRADGKGIERLDYSTYEVLLGGYGSIPKDVGIDIQKWYFAPRVGAMYRLSEKSVIRAGYGRTINPLPWSRPMRGSFPFDINQRGQGETFSWVTTLAQGIPIATTPDLSSGRILLPAGVYIRSPNPTDVDRGVIQSWNVAFEQRLPWDIAAEIAYVGTATDGGYADLNLNYGEPGGGNAARKYYSVAGTTSINDWASRTKNRYKALQIALNRPFRNGLMLKGAYTLSQAKDMTTGGEDGWTGLNWNHPIKYDDNFTIAVFDRTHIAQLAVLWQLPFFKESTGATKAILDGWQLNTVAGWWSGTPFAIGGSNTALNCQGCGSIYINYSGDRDPSPVGDPGAAEPYWDKSNFSQPTGVGYEGFGNTDRSFFRRPSVWNVDLSIFKSFSVGKVRPEIRIDVANVFNHPNWGAPVTTFTANNFLQFTPGSAESGTNSPGARRVQLGLRLEF